MRKLQKSDTVWAWESEQDIRSTYHHCHICAKFARTQQKETLQSIETPQTTWEQLGLDIFSLRNTQYLLVIDYFSWFPVVKQLQSLHSLSVIKHLKDIFTEIGIPRCIVSHGGTQFTSQEFKDFTKAWGICNDGELSCFEKSETCSKPPKHVFFALPNLPLSSPDTDSEDLLNITETPYIYEFYHLLTKTGFITPKLDLYKTRIYQFHY